MTSVACGALDKMSRYTVASLSRASGRSTGTMTTIGFGGSGRRLRDRMCPRLGQIAIGLTAEQRGAISEMGRPRHRITEQDLEPFNREIADVDKVLDLTSANVLKVSESLLRTDKAKRLRVFRRADPILRKYLPRLGRTWHDSTHGMKYRLQFLPDNPKFVADVNELRQLLGIPGGEISDTHASTSVAEIERQGVHVPDDARRAQYEMACGWLLHHRLMAQRPRKTGEFELPALPEVLEESAVTAARIDWATAEAPNWLKRASNRPRPRSPFDVAITNLMRHHRLPGHVEDAVALYVLTNNPRYITGMPPVWHDVREVVGDDEPKGCYAITFRFDEYTTEEDVMYLFRTVIEPLQHGLWRQAGLPPKKGRRAPDDETLTRAFRDYRAAIDTGGVAGVLNRYAADPAGREDAQIRTNIADIERLLKPV